MPIGVKGRAKVIIRIENTDKVRYMLGLLLKKGFLVLITRIIEVAEITDSMNQPVLNCSAEALKKKIRVRKVA